MFFPICYNTTSPSLSLSLANTFSLYSNTQTYTHTHKWYIFLLFSLSFPLFILFLSLSLSFCVSVWVCVWMCACVSECVCERERESVCEMCFAKSPRANHVFILGWQISSGFWDCQFGQQKKKIEATPFKVLQKIFFSMGGHNTYF